MGKRGPKKGICYKKNGIIDEVKIAIHRRNYPNATWTDTTRLIHPNSEAYSYCEFKNNKVKPVKRSFDKFKDVFSKLGLAKAKEWEKLINGGRITEPLWSFSREDKENFRISLKNSSNYCVFPNDEFKDKWNDVSSFLRDGLVVDWMSENFENKVELLKIWKIWKLEEETREEILELRGGEHLHVVSIRSGDAELVTGAEMFEQLNQRQHDGIEMILASIEKDKNKP
ncbi:MULTISPECIES: hypothetical protein [Shewanella]|uniref:hypothetical protein n=1 Tax=Shewanella TaxID=22 RepID=UPI000B49CD29|nr:hypothetical protein [Shewanella sp. Shew256]